MNKELLAIKPIAPEIYNKFCCLLTNYLEFILLLPLI